MSDREYRRNVHGLSRKQMSALALLEELQPAVVSSGRTAVYDNQLWMHWRTAYSLHDRGLARVHPYGEEDAEVVLS